ncbi:MAG: cyclase family protein [Eubacteriaceae bacterium]|nr:cyclase family protein [Eubacteriaceae bacterium]
MIIVDLSHTISMDMPVYPGTEKPVIEIANTIKDHGFLERKIHMYSHTGTHMDSPAHILANGKTLSDFSADQFAGKATIIDCTGITGGKITCEFLALFQERISRSDFVILKTGWSLHWGKNEYFSGNVVPDEKAATYLSGFDLKAVGIDAMSVDSLDDEKLPVHHILLSKEILII